MQSAEDTEKEQIIKPLFCRFAAGVGITVRGLLSAEGTEEERIVFTSLDEPPVHQHNRTVRLVDGPLVSEGIIQVETTERSSIVVLRHPFWASNFFA